MQNGTVLFLLILLAVMIFIGPYWTICAMNILFKLDIPHTWTTWLATLWLMFVISTRSGRNG